LRGEIWKICRQKGRWFQTYKKRSRSVLAKKEHIALQQLKKDPSITTTTADKSNITTVLDQEWYDNMINKMLDDEETYKRLKTNPNASTTKDVNKCINNLLESNKITKEACFRRRAMAPGHLLPVP